MHPPVMYTSKEQERDLFRREEAKSDKCFSAFLQEYSEICHCY